ncbi:uncharacterized protein LOC103312294 isoform X2 [Tribolium castaneum]|uniref:uncharacterized protein LOC103312294 isoform X2 n=1 Tax=Tribolium castaneum TaxID=7070 RepID=UPI00077DAB9A|nr:PREDICTED: uncharacterized protein LOC103312294 isoform X2 [Tribolium castaneum]|eukprot:XP_015833243.1 PREDICTED: uncharacterized protein LOC103312294 isoform X2 [Tribolium castaneum]
MKIKEERRRTGRYVATVIAIFVSLFGLYQAMARGTPEYAAFFLPALIMFFYVLWILYASRSRGKLFTDETTEALEDIKTVSENPSGDSSLTNPKPSTSQKPQIFSRSYSVA